MIQIVINLTMGTLGFFTDDNDIVLVTCQGAGTSMPKRIFKSRFADKMFFQGLYVFLHQECY